MFKECIICGTIFYKKSSHSRKYWEKRKLCSIKCHGIFTSIIQKGRVITWGDKISKSKIGHTVSQETIDKIKESRKGFRHTEETKLKVSGSNSAMWKGGRPKCACGKQLSDYKCKHCVKCNNELKLNAKFGEKNWRWRGGISSEHDKLRQSLEIKRWKKECKKRDNYTCQKDLSTRDNIVVHHIESFANFPELRTDVNNGIILSREAHLNFHKKFGYHNNTMEQLSRFLNT